MYFLNISGYLSVSWVWMKTFSSGLDWIWRNCRSRGACKKPVFWKSSWRGGVEDTRSCKREGVSECPCWTSWSSWGKFQLAFISPDTENHLILQGSLQHSFIQGLYVDWSLVLGPRCSYFVGGVFVCVMVVSQGQIVVWISCSSKKFTPIGIPLF